MERLNIDTRLGEVAVYKKTVLNTVPILLLHGVYYDHRLWQFQARRVKDRTVIVVDMPHHGHSKKIKIKDWTLNDCATMLIDIIISLKLEMVYAIGHSWGQHDHIARCSKTSG